MLCSLKLIVIRKFTQTHTHTSSALLYSILHSTKQAINPAAMYGEWTGATGCEWWRCMWKSNLCVLLWWPLAEGTAPEHGADHFAIFPGKKLTKPKESFRATHKYLLHNDSNASPGSPCCLPLISGGCCHIIILGVVSHNAPCNSLTHTHIDSVLKNKKKICHFPKILFKKMSLVLLHSFYKIYCTCWWHGD